MSCNGDRFHSVVGPPLAPPGFGLRKFSVLRDPPPSPSFGLKIFGLEGPPPQGSSGVQKEVQGLDSAFWFLTAEGATSISGDLENFLS